MLRTSAPLIGALGIGLIMRDDDKKQRERQYIDALIATLWPSTKVACQPSESPDWLITFPHQLVGVEVTELPDSTFRPIEGREEKVIAKAIEVAEKRNFPPSHVRVGFSRGQSIPHTQVDPLALALAECVQSQYDATQHVQYEVPMKSPLLPYIDLVSISSSSVERGHNWRDLRANKIRDLEIQAIQSALDSKAEKVSVYKSKCTESWLVIGAEGSYSSSAFRTGGRAIGARYRTEFNRAFYVNLTGIEVKELTLCPNN